MAVDEVAIAHDLGHGDNRRSSLGPLYRCNVLRRRRLQVSMAIKPKRWLVLSRILVPSTKALARPQINALSPNIAILWVSLLGPTNVSNMQHPL